MPSKQADGLVTTSTVKTTGQVSSVHARRLYTETKSTTPFIYTYGVRWIKVIIYTPGPLYSRERTSNRRVGGHNGTYERYEENTNTLPSPGLEPRHYTRYATPAPKCVGYQQRHRWCRRPIMSNQRCINNLLHHSSRNFGLTDHMAVKYSHTHNTTAQAAFSGSVR
jgi:hypothetical protein